MPASNIQHVKVTIIEGRNLPDCDLRQPDASAVMSVFMKPSAATTFATHVDRGTYNPQWHYSAIVAVEDENDAIQFELFMKPPTASVTSALRAQGILPKDNTGKAPPPLTQSAVRDAAKTAAKAAASAARKSTAASPAADTENFQVAASPPPPGRESAVQLHGNYSTTTARQSTAEWDGIVSVPDWLLGRTVVPIACAAGVPYYDSWHRLTDCRKGGPELHVRIEILEASGNCDSDSSSADGDREGESPNPVDSNNYYNKVLKRSETKPHLDNISTPEGGEDQKEVSKDLTSNTLLSGKQVCSKVDSDSPSTLPPLSTQFPLAASSRKIVAKQRSKTDIIAPGWYFIKNCHNTYMCLAPYFVMQTNTMSEWCRIYIDTAFEPSTTTMQSSFSPPGSSSTAFREPQNTSLKETAVFGKGSGTAGGSNNTSKVTLNQNTSEGGAATKNNSAANFMNSFGSNVKFLANKIPIVGSNGPSTVTAIQGGAPIGQGVGFDATGGAKRNGVLYSLRSSADRGLLDAAHDKSKHVKKDALQVFKNFGGGGNNKNQKQQNKDEGESSRAVTHTFATLQKVNTSSSALSKRIEWHMLITEKEPHTNPLSLFEIIPHPRHPGKYLIHSTVAGVNLVAEPGGWGAGYSSITKPSDWATFELIQTCPSPLKAPHISPGAYLIQSCFGTYICGLKKKITHRRGNDDGVKVTVTRVERDGGDVADLPSVFGLQTAFGNFIGYENGRCEAANQINAWEKFEVQPHPTLPDRYTIYSCAFKTYLSCKGPEELTKIRNSDTVGNREGFGFIRVDAPGVI